MRVLKNFGLMRVLRVLRNFGLIYVRFEGFCIMLKAKRIFLCVANYPSQESAGIIPFQMELSRSNLI